MALGHKLSGLNRTNWETKSNSQKQKILTNHFNNLGYKVPNYFNEKISDSKLQKAVSRIAKGYTKQIQKEKQNKGNLNNQLKQALKNHNTKVNNTLNGVTKNMQLTQNQLNYLQGQEVFLSIRNKPFSKDSDILALETLTGHKFKTDNDKKDFISLLNQKAKNLNYETYSKKLNDSSDSDKFYSEFLDEKFNEDLSENDKYHMLKQFNELTPLQKEIVIKGELSELRIKYQDMEDSGQDFSVNNVFDRTLKAIRTVKEEF